MLFFLGLPLLLGFSYTGTFPKPLSKEEEAHVLHLYESGSPAEQKQAKDTLILHNLRLVAHISKKFNLSIKDTDESISIGVVGLIKGINSFNAKKNVRLASYVAKCIQNELLMWLRSGKKSQYDISLFEPIGTDRDGNEIVILDVVSDEETDFADVLDQSIKIQKMYASLKTILNPREYKVIVLRYGLFNSESYTQQEIADLLNISRSYISRIEKKALKKLYAELQNA